MPVDRHAVVSAFPELAAVPDGPQWTAALADAADLVGDRFGSRNDMAVRLYAAHLISQAKQVSTGRGEVISESAGGVTRTYAAGGGGFTSSGAALSSSPYGVRFMALVRGTLGGPLLSS